MFHNRFIDPKVCGYHQQVLFFSSFFFIVAESHLQCGHLFLSPTTTVSLQSKNFYRTDKKWLINYHYSILTVCIFKSIYTVFFSPCIYFSVFTSFLTSFYFTIQQTWQGVYILLYFCLPYSCS